MKSASQVLVRPARNVRGSVTLPGDKSISHRYAMLAALADGASRLENYSTGADCASTLGCLRSLGVKWKKKEEAENVIEMQGSGMSLTAPNASLDCGNSGSTIRMLSGILSAQNFACELSGDESLSRRPMERVITPLAAMGARITSQNGRPPLCVHGAHLKGIHYGMPVASAQVKTCVLFAGLLAEGETSVHEPVRTRDHGEMALRAFGATLNRKGNEIGIRGGQRLHGITARIPGDISSAAFFFCAAALFPESQLTITNLLMNPTRARLLDILVQFGLRISVSQIEEAHGELIGTVKVQGGCLKGGALAGADSAALIDEIPVLAAIAPSTERGIEVRDAKELRVKESDRIAAIARNLRAMGAEVEEREDGLKIPGGQKLHGAEVDSFSDHRIAMAFSVAALRAEGDSLIRGSECAAVSYPAFFTALDELVEH